MTGQAYRNAQLVQKFAAEGLDAAQIAHRLGLGSQHVRVLARDYGVVLPRVGGVPARILRRAELVTRLRTLAAEGLTRQQAADRLSMGYITIVNYAIAHDIQFKRAGKKAGGDERSAQMAALYRQGMTLAEIGVQYRITRERVRQIITKYHGLRAMDGGAALTSALGRAARLNKIEARYQKRYGCSRAQYRDILRAGGTRAYSELQRNTKRDDIKLELTLWQWWTLWQQSGHWEHRGRGRGYWMFRPRSDAPLSVDNVCIAPGDEAMSFMRETEPSRFKRHRAVSSDISAPPHGGV